MIPVRGTRSRSHWSSTPKSNPRVEPDRDVGATGANFTDGHVFVEFLSGIDVVIEEVVVGLGHFDIRPHPSNFAAVQR